MAERSVAIRLAVKDGEIVRRELKEIGEQGKRAMTALDDASRAPTRSALALSDAIGEIRSSVAGVAEAGGALGPALTFLRGIGPAGVAAGVAVVAGGAAIAAGIGTAKEALDAFGDIADRANEFGLSTDVYQGIAASAVTAGVGQEQLNAALSRFTAEAGRAAEGQGELYEKIAQYNPAAAEMLRTAENQEERIRALAVALSEAETAEQRAAIATAAFGRAGIAVGRALGETRGELQRLVEQARDMGQLVPVEAIRNAEELGDRLDSAGVTIRTQLLVAAADLAPLMVDAAEAAASMAKYIGDAYRGLAGGLYILQKLRENPPVTQIQSTPAESLEALEQDVERIKQALAELPPTPQYGADLAGMQRGLLQTQLSDLERRRDEARKLVAQDAAATPAAAPEPSGPKIPLPRVRTTQTFAEQDAALAAEREAAEKRQRESEQASAEAKRKKAEADREVAGAAREALETEREAARVRSELGDVTGLVAIRQRELTELVSKGALTQDEATAALTKYRAEVEQTAKAEAARSSAFASLARLSEQSSDLKGLYDEGASDVVRKFSGDMENLVKVGGSAGDTFRSLKQYILDAITQMVVARGITGPLATLLGQVGDTTFGIPAKSGVRVGGGAPSAALAAAPTVSAARMVAPQAAPATGQALAFAPHFRAGVDARLVEILDEAAKTSPYKVEAFSGRRPGDPRLHGQGLAADVALIDPATGARLPNYQNGTSFRAYEEFAQNARRVQMDKYPELGDDFRWGGYFGGPKGKYGANDAMHFDLGGRRAGMAGGSWEGGLTDRQRSFFPDATSVGMGDMPKEFASAGQQVQAFAAKTGEATTGLDGFGARLTDGARGVGGSAEGIKASAESVSASTGELAKTTAAVPAQAQGLFQTIGGALGSGLDGLIGMLTSVLGSGTGGGAGNIVSTLMSVFSFADGGVMAGAPLRRFQAGGVAYGRMFSEFGEGAVPEAYVPLQDGRTIPVTVRQDDVVAELLAVSAMTSEIHSALGDRSGAARSGAGDAAAIRALVGAVPAAPPPAERPISVQVNNAPAPLKEAREEDDGRGGRRLAMTFSDMSGDELSRRGSRSQKALKNHFGLRSAPPKR